MKIVAGVSLGAAALAGCVFFLLSASGGLGGEPATQWLGVAGVVVAMASLSQVVFAVVAYMEAAVFRKEITKLKTDLIAEVELRKSAVVEVGELYYRASRTYLQALLEALAEHSEPEVYETALGKLKGSQLALELAHGTYFSLSTAMQAALKTGSRRFLELESEIWERSERLPLPERDRIRRDYKILKRRVLDRRLSPAA